MVVCGGRGLEELSRTLLDETLRKRERQDPAYKALGCNIGASITTNTVLGVPYYKYSIMGPKTLF